MEELAIPFSKYITEHLKINDKQGVSSGSKFLEQCRLYNNKQCSKDELLSQTVFLGFNNVDVYPNLDKPEPKRFYDFLAKITRK